MNLEEYQQYLKQKIAEWEHNEREDYTLGLQDAAWRANVAKSVYEDALQKSKEIKL